MKTFKERIFWVSKVSLGVIGPSVGFPSGGSVRDGKGTTKVLRALAVADLC